MYEEEYVLEERVDRLESLLGHFIVHTDTAITRLEREMRREMTVFTDQSFQFSKYLCAGLPGMGLYGYS